MTKWRRTSSRYVFFIFLLAVSAQVGGTVFADSRGPPVGSSAATTQTLLVDVYSDQGGRGQNKTMGAYTIGDTVKFYIYITRNSMIQVTVITPNGSVWLRMAGPVEPSGPIIDYFDTQYPTGEWAISAKAEAGNETASDIAPFKVVDKHPYICTKTSLFDTSGNTGETKFTGKVVKTYLYPVGGVHSWDVKVDMVYFGHDIRNQTVHVQILTATYSLGHPPGYLDENITLGDEVAVYGLLNGESVSVNGSVNYYVERLSMLCEQTQAPNSGSEGIGLQAEEFLIIIALLVIALTAVRKKYPRMPLLSRVNVA